MSPRLQSQRQKTTTKTAGNIKQINWINYIQHEVGPLNSYVFQKKKAMPVMCACVLKVWSVVCPVRRHCWRGSRAWKSLLSVFGETNSHFISCGADHHTSVATHSVLSAAAQTCHFHLYGSIRHRGLPKGSNTDLAFSSRRRVKRRSGYAEWQ